MLRLFGRSVKLNSFVWMFRTGSASTTSNAVESATAILIDATIVRAVLLPAAMKLLGDWNWYLPRWLEWLPRWLEWLPRLNVEPDLRGEREEIPEAPAVPALNQ